jgi:energy-coupling factor transport system substrate-specific component
VRLRSALALTLVFAVGIVAFGWPFLTEPGSALDTSHSGDAPMVFVLILPLLAAVVLAELTAGGIDAKAVAMLGMLAAVGGALRALGPGTAGLEPSFAVIILGGRVFGRGFGFVLGAVTLFTGALITGGVGPWLPFQMICAAWVGMGAGLLPRRVSGRAEIGMLVAYAVVASYLYGMLMNLSFWPFTLGIVVPGHEGALAYVAGAPVLENGHRFLVYTLLTSTGGWDTGRAITTGIAIAVLGPAILATLRRAARRAVVRPG